MYACMHACIYTHTHTQADLRIDGARDNMCGFYGSVRLLISIQHTYIRTHIYKRTHIRTHI